jgi:predicted transcriptional regulator
MTGSGKDLGMTEFEMDKLWNVVPVGEANAAAASEIWKRLDMWARSTVQHNLSSMAEAGRIRRISRLMRMGGEVNLYYRG